MTDEEFENELERRLSAQLKEEGEDEYSDSDHAMYLRQDLATEIRDEEARKTNIDRMKEAVDDNTC